MDHPGAAGCGVVIDETNEDDEEMPLTRHLKTGDRSMRRSRLTALAGGVMCCVLAMFATPALAQVTYTVDPGGSGDFETVQAAISASVDGDTVELVPGTYRERINLLGKKITVRGSTGLSFLHIISKPETGSGRLVSMNGGEDANTVLDGMTIRQSTEGGLYLNNASPTIRNCRFVENTVGDQGGAVSINGTSTPRFEDCEFSDNAASGGTNIRGGAIFMTGSGVDATFVDCAFNRNLSRANQNESRADGGGDLPAVRKSAGGHGLHVQYQPGLGAVELGLQHPFNVGHRWCDPGGIRHRSTRCWVSVPQ